jgi:hypothetical protein
MKDKKSVYAAYAFYDRTGIRNFLEKKARQGWMLKSFSGDTWRFTRIEPRELHFCISYYPAAWNVERDSPLSQQRQEFVNFCEHGGWKLVCFNGAMHIFCSAEENPIPIETDAILEMETIHKATKKTYLHTRIPIAVLHAIVAILHVLILPYRTERIEMLYDLLDMAFHSLMGLYYGLEVFLYYAWRRKALAAVRAGNGFTETKSNPYSPLVFLISLTALCIWELGVMTVTDFGAFVIIIVLLLSVGGFIGLFLLLLHLLSVKEEK